MTPYRERLHAGEYAAEDAQDKPRESTTSDKLTGLTGTKQATTKGAAKK